MYTPRRAAWVLSGLAVAATGALRPDEPAPALHLPTKYNRSAMENRRQLQCKALRRREKSRQRRNNGKQWKKQCAETMETVELRARNPRPIVTPTAGNGAARRRPQADRVCQQN